jgi:CBS domain-containing protein
MTVGLRDAPLPSVSSRVHTPRTHPRRVRQEVPVQISQLLRHKGREVATIDSSESVRAALGLLADKGIGALVVSSDGRRIDGILSERDVARGLHERGAGLLAEPVSSVMTAQVHTCSPNMSVHDLARTMTDKRVRHVPVVEDDVLIGIVSIGDVVKARLDELEEERRQLVDYIQTP